VSAISLIVHLPRCIAEPTTNWQRWQRWIFCPWNPGRQSGQ